VRGDIYLKGWARLLQPFLRGYVRRQMERLQLQPVRAEAEARAGTPSRAPRGKAVRDVAGGAPRR
jgi:hypothetical protein